MCGATSQQDQLQQEQIDAYQQAQQMTAEQYENQQAIYGPMAAQFESIFAKGPSQEGFSTDEKNTLNASAVEGTAENYAGAARAVGEQEAAEGGGDSPLPTGSQEQLRAEVADSSAKQESAEETQVNEADYQQGYNQWTAAAGGLDAIASGENPLGYESAETGAGSAAASTANQIASENNSWISAALGAAGTIGGAVVSENPGDIFG